MTKKLLAILAVCMLGLTALKADVFVGYDGDCQVFYRTYYGFYRYCPDYGSIFLGPAWNGLTWNDGFFWQGGRRWNNFGHRWQGGHNWQGQGNWHGGGHGGWHGSHGGGRGTPGGHAGHGGHGGH